MAMRYLGSRASLARTRSGRLALTAVVGTLVAVVGFIVASRLAETPWPLSGVDPGLLVVACALSGLGYTLKAYGWGRLFAADERPPPLALAAALGGASISAVALPGRFDDVVRIAIVRRFRNCPAGVRPLCLSLVMLGLIDAVALAPFALAAALLPGHAMAVRVGLVFLAAVGLAAAVVVLAMPGISASRVVLRFRLGRWLRPRTTTPRDALEALGFVSACWLSRIVGLFLLLGALGVGFSFTLALLFLCASSAAAALPVGPGGTATQAGAGAAVLIASGLGASEALAVAFASQVVGLLVGGAILLLATGWRTGLRLAPRFRAAAPALGRS
jgi:uncharacterized membrane protein YbhN (UPF0104 family)